MESDAGGAGGSRVPTSRKGGLRTAPVLVPALLAFGAAALCGGGLIASVAPAAGCPPLAGAQPVAVTARAAGGDAHGVTGYLFRNGEALIPVRGLVERTGRIYWDESGQTVTLLGPRDVLSVHVPGGRAETRIAVLNGEVIAAHAVRCEEQVYLPADLVATVLHLEVAVPSDDRGERMSR